ncbi:hypothetical protein COW36_13855 [bacterium (Candidatus Blackallbacteria) CG17_big_fil_post_rev_8_21_14_2_50_48_46]|uniref:Lipoyl-binding domain-containing protein n=1 Tax=bacterium (Candidatus Blackallbacteria) CG17_big_fil_post_rev_8_21_14_2_50_48_46 TaxID=2014261 RepID=A0A2M7G312_9BACT|nr:MAG: hypothetical protein COW64_23330 [bacterium (Candidatus Blackallbacteria) CG18_big_fil_WC_8_21_14_2_50_49_26]PIW16211.1 MAG: hypothetical protein COW36_13855 [bacterium (Candidatus Blackallbacteria) CG17_big_fil_post_rev_8_21_14_2_50_48_46]PIW49906.1 MAG: hypothetical protein COW20_04450 [bacterium (Candidatus Blackallbacteria) CG13_big_fil_rev_8_21_14_2_50_49_14]
MPVFKHHHSLYDLDGKWQDQQFLFSAEAESQTVSVQELEAGTFLVRQGSQVSLVHAVQEGNHLLLSFQGQTYLLERQKKASAHQPEDPVSNHLEAPLTGKVLQVQVEEGQTLEAGVSAVILESMKMETALMTPFAARVMKIHCAAGDSVSTGQVLVELEPLEDDV